MGFDNIFQPIEYLCNNTKRRSDANDECACRQPVDVVSPDCVSTRGYNGDNGRRGVNWTLLAGGAFVTAVSVAFCGKRQRSCVAGGDSQPVKSAEAMAVPDTVSDGDNGKDGVWQDSFVRRRQFPATSPSAAVEAYARVYQPHGHGDCNGSEYSVTPPGNEPVCFTSAAKQLVAVPQAGSSTPSPQLYEGQSHYATPTTPQQGEKLNSNPSSRAHFSARHDMLHRLRQQVKSRDELILEVHTQLRDQERTIRLHEGHRRELEERLQVTNRSLYEAQAEIQKLRRALSGFADRDAHRAAGSAELNSQCRLRQAETQRLPSGRFDRSPQTTQQACQEQLLQQQHDLQLLSAEVKRLADELRDAEQVRKEREISVSKENEFLMDRLKHVEAQLEGARRSNIEKDQLLQTYKAQFVSASEATQLSRKLESRLGDTGRGLENPCSHDDVSPLQAQSSGVQTGTGGYGTSPIAESFSHHGDVVRSYNTLFATTPEPSSRGASTSKTCSVERDLDLAADGEIIESLLVALQEEVDQLSTALGESSRVQVMDKKAESSQLVDKLQRTLEELGVAAPDNVEDREELTHFLSFSKGITSAVQVQELSHKLEQVARQQKVEEEILELGKHQSRIAELKERVERLSMRFSCSQEETAEECQATEKQSTRLASLAVELAKKLTLQEEQARQTCWEAQRITASSELSSPYVPLSKKEELRKILHYSRIESSATFSDSWHEHASTSDNHSSRARYLTESEEARQFSGECLFDHNMSLAEPSSFQSPDSDRRFASIHHVEDSPAMRIGSPTIIGDLRTPTAKESGEGRTRASGTVVRDINKLHGSHVMSGGPARDRPIDLARDASTAMSPFSKMMARLELNQAEKTPGLTAKDLEDYGRQMLESYNDPNSEVGIEGNGAERFDKHSESGSLDSSFDDMLDNTLEDFVRVCSEATTPATSPASSTVSTG